VTLADAAARSDPLVGGVDEFLQIGIGQDAFRQKTAGARDACVDQSLSPFLQRSKFRARKTHATRTRKA
jgi:hypothetical protein